jgi:YD repeat-containing protein
LTTQYQYDANGRNTLVVNPDGSTTSNIYDSLGKVVARVDQKSRSTNYWFDNLGRTVKTDYPDETNETTNYDAEVMSITGRTGVPERPGMHTMNKVVRRRSPIPMVGRPSPSMTRKVAP